MMQGAAVTLAVGQKQPFGLSGVGQLTDLYLPTAEEPLFGEPVYKGMDTGAYMFSCNPSAVPQLWAFSTSQERAAWQRCEGSMQVDLRKGEARLALLSSPEAEVVPMVVHDLGVCSTPFTGAAPAVSADSQTVVLTKSLRSTDVACWLTRFWGPQVAAGAAGIPSRIELGPRPAADSTVDLITDLIVCEGQTLDIGGNGVTIGVKSRQLRVDAGGTLSLSSVSIAEAAPSSAVYVEGSLVARNGSFRDCTAQLNVFSASGLQSSGGALYVTNGGDMELVATDLTANRATGGVSFSQGGAILAEAASKVALFDCRLQRNAAEYSKGSCLGGAMALLAGSKADVANTEFVQNVAISGATTARGGAIYASGSAPKLSSSRFVENSVQGGNEAATSQGGAVFLTSSKAQMAQCEVIGNTAT